MTKPVLSDLELLYVSRAVQGECESVYKQDINACYGIALTIYNRYNSGKYGSILNIVQSSYYGYVRVKTPDPTFVKIAQDALTMDDFTNGSIYAFSYPQDVTYLGIENKLPSYKTEGIWFYNYFPEKSYPVYTKDVPAISVETCLKLKKCYYETITHDFNDGHILYRFTTKQLVYHSKR